MTALLLLATTSRKRPFYSIKWLGCGFICSLLYMKSEFGIRNLDLVYKIWIWYTESGFCIRNLDLVGEKLRVFIWMIKKGHRTQPASSLFSLLGCFPAKCLGGRSNRCFPGYCCCGCSHFLYVFFINILVTDHYAKLQQKENSTN